MNRSITLPCMLGAFLGIAFADPLTGAATFRERIALPANAVFEAQIEDVSRADAPATILGSVRREPAGNPPYEFSIAYDPSKIIANHRYSVRARITIDRRLRFTTDESYPVLTNGHSNKMGRMMILKRVRTTAPKVPQPPAAALYNLP